MIQITCPNRERRRKLFGIRLPLRRDHHVTLNNNVTLCGRDCDGWMAWAPDLDDEVEDDNILLCKHCQQCLPDRLMLNLD
jgi:hypothetical protein